MMKKRTKIICSVISIILSLILLNLYFFPSLVYAEDHRGIGYYENNLYQRFGVGLNRYGKIASHYLPDYSELSEGSTYMDFHYVDSSNFALEFVYVAVGVRYEAETYKMKRDEIKTQSSDFGNRLTLDVYGRLVSHKRRINGEDLYYIVTYSDTDNAIMHWVVFSSGNYGEKANLFLVMDDTMVIFTEFWQHLHPITTVNGDFGPKYIQ